MSNPIQYRSIMLSVVTKGRHNVTDILRKDHHHYHVPNIKPWNNRSNKKGTYTKYFFLIIHWFQIASEVIGFICYYYRYLRAQNPYSPPQDVCKTVLQLKATANCATGSFDNEFNLGDKFKFLSLCSTEFNHTVPNSVLHEINTYGELTMQIIDPMMIIEWILFFVVLRRCHCILWNASRHNFTTWWNAQANITTESAHPTWIHSFRSEPRWIFQGADCISTSVYYTYRYQSKSKIQKHYIWAEMVTIIIMLLHLCTARCSRLVPKKMIRIKIYATELNLWCLLFDSKLIPLYTQFPDWLRRLLVYLWHEPIYHLQAQKAYISLFISAVKRGRYLTSLAQVLR